MLNQLFVKDFAIARAVEIALSNGMTVISGETGAGKSLLVDALLYLSGARADAGVVRHGAARAELIAEFELSDSCAAQEWLRSAELDDESDQCQLRRVIRADGGSKAWINGRPATLAQLAELSSLLVEIHGQHEHQALLDRERQCELLDAFAAEPAVLAEVCDCASRWRETRLALERLHSAGDTRERADWVRHQVQELEGVALDVDRIEALQVAHRRYSHGVALVEGIAAAVGRLSEERSGISQSLQRLRSDLARLAGFEPQLAEVDALLDSAQIQCDEAASLLGRLHDGIDLDPQRLVELERQLAQLHDLARKHRVGVGELAARRQALRDELAALEGAGQREAELRTTLANLQQLWTAAAARLTAIRQNAAASMTSAVTELMQQLGMPGGRFDVALEPAAVDPHVNGAERIEFLVSANPGQPTRPLRKVASGGELARIALAIEVAALGLDAVPTMVFDEVDSGIGGAVAEIVGRLLRSLGRERQVLCVTHLAQVAAQGHHHLRVDKTSRNGQTESSLVALDEASRQREIARMLGGVDITAATRAHAAQMLASAGG